MYLPFKLNLVKMDMRYVEQTAKLMFEDEKYSALKKYTPNGLMWKAIERETWENQSADSRLRRMTEAHYYITAFLRSGWV